MRAVWRLMWPRALGMCSGHPLTLASVSASAVRVSAAVLGLQRVLLQIVALGLGWPSLQPLRILLDGGAHMHGWCAAQEEQGGAGVYSADLRKAYRLKSDEWKYDIAPEIIDGHNVADFVDADIEARLAALEREEDALAAAAALEARPPSARAFLKWFWLVHCSAGRGGAGPVHPWCAQRLRACACVPMRALRWWRRSGRGSKSQSWMKFGRWCRALPGFVPRRRQARGQSRRWSAQLKP